MGSIHFMKSDYDFSDLIIRSPLVPPLERGDVRGAISCPPEPPYESGVAASWFEMICPCRLNARRFNEGEAIIRV
jgi:hypothetical protein